MHLFRHSLGSKHLAIMQLSHLYPPNKRALESGVQDSNTKQLRYTVSHDAVTSFSQTAIMHLQLEGSVIGILRH
ncbi:hypothetical protein QC763_0054690 [Podospora pseudopauciseta]|uniref:Uncharacterized protein n=1 Tax=Podospora pseudopauciseta TaxID=2093780 RepID=A0ABR0HH26_9PEZI|nr:hypothetical protein QC763_0054690 [Podospora pseudopauciseta]